MTYSDLKQLFLNRLSALYSPNEAESILFFYLYYRLEMEKYQWTLRREEQLSEVCMQTITADLDRLASGFPVQYLVGKCEFFNCELSLNGKVLIPRPETEELVVEVVNRFQNRSAQRVLDVGTGSGAIALALKRYLPQAEVWATDFSENALECARENAENLKLDVNFLHHDILNDTIDSLPQDLDILISNPPYIPISEKENLHRNVKDYEPDSALFVPDSTPLIFYKKIAQVGIKLLKPTGVLLFETYHLFQNQMVEMLQSLGYKQVVITKDLQGKSRFVEASMSE